MGFQFEINWRLTKGKEAVLLNNKWIKNNKSYYLYISNGGNMFKRHQILLKILIISALTVQTTQPISWDWLPSSVYQEGSKLCSYLGGTDIYKQSASCCNWLFEKGKRHPSIVVVGTVGLLALAYWQVKSAYDGSARKENPGSFNQNKLEEKGKEEAPAQNDEFVDLMDRSETFEARYVKFPTEANRIKVIAGNDPKKQAHIVWQAQNTYPIIMQETVQLINDFIDYKKKHGTEIEKSFYQNMDVNSFVNRLLIKRPLVFYTPDDSALLQGGKDGQGGFEQIGTYDEQEPLMLKDYLSYDEMQISALLGVSTPTYFINNGNRYNCGDESLDGTYQDQGVYVGLVGTRFEKPNVMEWQHMIITLEQNQAKNGYGPDAKQSNPKIQLLNLWATFYGLEYFSTFEQAEEDQSGRFVALDSNLYLDTLVYKKRLKMVMDIFLCDAQQRALDMKKKAYCHVVGLGLGYWALDQDIQAQCILKVLEDSIRELNLSEVGDIDFSWFPPGVKSDMLSDGKTVQQGQNNIKIHFSKRNPADKLDDESKLLVAMYAWDGNAYPGNEYWIGQLSASGDPAAASCSTIPELQNPQINPYLSSGNLRVYANIEGLQVEH